LKVKARSDEPSSPSLTRCASKLIRTGVSPSWMLSAAVPGEPTLSGSEGLASVRRKNSSGSSALSATTGMAMVCSVSPSAKLTTPKTFP
jgi:hypothetical protein